MLISDIGLIFLSEQVEECYQKQAQKPLFRFFFHPKSKRFDRYCTLAAAFTIWNLELCVAQS